jgi:hypothetical protein
MSLNYQNVLLSAWLISRVILGVYLQAPCNVSRPLPKPVNIRRTGTDPPPLPAPRPQPQFLSLSQNGDEHNSKVRPWWMWMWMVDGRCRCRTFGFVVLWRMVFCFLFWACWFCVLSTFFLENPINYHTTKVRSGWQGILALLIW